MRSKLVLSISVLSLLLFISSCGVHQAVTANHTANNTEVQLSKKNYVIVGKVTGSSNAQYVLGFGGIANKSLLSKARADMYEKAKLEGTSKAIINETIETHVTMIQPLYMQKTLTVSGYIVEFKD